MTSNDERFMRRALELADQGRGLTSPNPMVGAVVVAPSGEVVGEGVHRRAGRPHAPITALRAAGPRTRGATLLVTLEPSAHHGRTPPRATAAIQAGLSRVAAPLAGSRARRRGLMPTGSGGRRTPSSSGLPPCCAMPLS